LNTDVQKEQGRQVGNRDTNGRQSSALGTGSRTPGTENRVCHRQGGEHNSKRDRTHQYSLSDFFLIAVKQTRPTSGLPQASGLRFKHYTTNNIKSPTGKAVQLQLITSILPLLTLINAIWFSSTPINIMRKLVVAGDAFLFPSLAFPALFH